VAEKKLRIREKEEKKLIQFLVNSVDFGKIENLVERELRWNNKEWNFKIFFRSK